MRSRERFHPPEPPHPVDELAEPGRGRGHEPRSKPCAEVRKDDRHVDVRVGVHPYHDCVPFCHDGPRHPILLHSSGRVAPAGREGGRYGDGARWPSSYEVTVRLTGRCPGGSARRVDGSLQGHRVSTETGQAGEAEPSGHIITVQKLRIGPVTRSFFEFARLARLSGHDGESRLSNGPDNGADSSELPGCESEFPRPIRTALRKTCWSCPRSE
jgi:hypothetical protein